MLFGKRFVAGNVDGHFELDVAELRVQSLVFGVNGRDLFGEPAELASTFDDPYEADVARDGTKRGLEY